MAFKTKIFDGVLYLPVYGNSNKKEFDKKIAKLKSNRKYRIIKSGKVWVFYQEA